MSRHSEQIFEKNKAKEHFLVKKALFPSFFSDFYAFGTRLIGKKREAIVPFPT
jgi:hypothetical protein